MFYHRKVVISKDGFILAFEQIEAIGWYREPSDIVIDNLRDDVIMTVHMVSGRSHEISISDQKTQNIVSKNDFPDNQQLANYILHAWVSFKEGRQ